MTLDTPRGWLEALIAGLLRYSLKLLLKPVFSTRFSIPFQRRWLRLLSHTTLVPRQVSIEPARVGGVPGEWLRRRGFEPVKSGVMLYLHGGAYCVGSPATHRALTGRLTLTTGLPVFSLDYRLAPEHPFPAALDDALAAFHALNEMGPVVIAGDSAGGGLALATALALRDAGGARPAALVLFSPWVDMTMTDVPPEHPGEAMLSVSWAEACARHYLAGRPRPTPADSPLTSPLRAELHGLPPVLIQAGTDELLHGQALQLEQALLAAGSRVECQVTSGRWHVFQMHGGALRSADEALGRVAGFLLKPLAQAAQPTQSRHEVVILGGGMSGLCMAYQLQRAGMQDFVIIEKQDGLGGTWWDNTYPGAHVDVPAPVYSLSFAPNPDWKRRFASAPEIQSYMQGVAQRHGLLAHLRISTRLINARFDEAEGCWHFLTDRGDRLQSRFFVCSTGPLNQPRWPMIPGLDRFQGKRLHSARWDHGCELAGQRVAVIGTGSTASQLVPPIAEKAATLHVFQRTANWVLPRLDRPYGGLDHFLARLPLYPRLVRWSWVQALEFGRRGFEEGTFARRRMLAMAHQQLQDQIPDTTMRQDLLPPYPLGCKRIIYSNDYFPALARPNVELVTDTIVRITPNGIVTRDGRERPVDVLVCATGFETTRLLSSVKILGLEGRSLREVWSEGPHAYNGITVSGFPNMFLMLGPNTATGHTSTLLYIEPEVAHAIDCMKAVRAAGKRWIDVKPEVLASHNQKLQARLGGSVWTHCSSWYRTESGRITALFPGFTSEYVRALKRLNLNDYRLQ